MLVRQKTSCRKKGHTVAKATLNPILKLIPGKLGNLVFPRAHTGKITVKYKRDWSYIKWNLAQKAHRERFAAAVSYAQDAMNDPAVRTIYEQMAAEKKNNKRPFGMAVSHYFAGNNLLQKYRFDDRNKPNG